MEQGSFLFPEPTDHQAKAEEWVKANPDAFAAVERVALEKARRRQKFGIGQITEIVRWEMPDLKVAGSDGFKMNNNHRAYIARMLIERHPELGEFIETRRVKA